MVKKIKSANGCYREHRNPSLPAGIGKTLPDKCPSSWHIFNNKLNYKNVLIGMFFLIFILNFEFVSSYLSEQELEQELINLGYGWLVNYSVNHTEISSQIPELLSARVEVYEKDSDEVIAVFENVSEFKKYKILLTELNDSAKQDTFDLKVVSSDNQTGGVEFDYVVDPLSTNYTLELVDTGENLVFPTIAIDSDNVTYIAYKNTSRLFVCNNSDSSWQCDDIDDTGRGRISIAIGSDNVVNIAHWYSNRIRYCNNSGGTWSCENVVTIGTADNRVIVVGTDNVPHIFYSDYNYEYLAYAYKSGGSWTIDSRIGSESADWDKIISPAIDPNGTIQVLYVNPSNSRFKICNNTQGWVCRYAINGSSYISGRQNALATDSGSNLHLSYSCDHTLGYCNRSSTADNDEWECFVIEDLNNGGSGLYYPTTILVDSEDHIHITYFDSPMSDSSEPIRYCKNSGGSWSCETIQSYVNDGGVSKTSIAIKKGNLASFPGNFSDNLHGTYYNASTIYYWYNESSCSSTPTANKFAIKNSAGNNIASIDDAGNMFIAQSAYESQSSLSPGANSFIVKNSAGTVIAYVDTVGQLYLKGTVTESSVSGTTSTNLEFRDSSNTLVGFFDNTGNLKLNGELCQNYESP